MKLSWVVFMIGILVSCDVSNPVLEDEIIVVEGYLIAGRSFSKIRLRWVVTPGEVSADNNNYDRPVSGASIQLLEGSRIFTLIEDTSRIPNTFPPRTNHGNYLLSSGDTLIVKYDREYVLQIDAPAEVWAVTRTPKKVTVALSDSTRHISYPTSPPGLRISHDSASGGFIAMTGIDYTQPVNLEFGGSNQYFTTDSVFTIPWSNFLTLGTSTVYVYAFDYSYVRYLRTRRLGNPTQSISEPEFSVLGGLGVFASASIDSIILDIQ